MTTTDTRDAAAGTEPLVLVQVLRALAALLVLAGHTQGLVVANARLRGEQLTPLQFPGGFGVDLFFCISGFIIVVSSRGLFGSARSRALFLLRRATRLVPLYWIATLGVLPIVLFGRTGYGGDLATALATSLLFWPYPTYGVEGEAVFPLYTLGWTLNYEVFFYALFALFVVLPLRRAVLGVCATLVAIVAVGLVAAPQETALRFWTQPIVVEFAFGALAGLGWLRGFRLDAVEAAGLASAACLLALLNPFGLTVAPGTTTTPNDLLRVAAWGLPAIALLCAAIGYEQGRRLDAPWLAPLRQIGDSSYSLYLLHPFALVAVTKLWTAFALHRFFGWPTLALAMVLAAIGLALLSYRWIERPATRSLLQLALPRRGLAA